MAKLPKLYSSRQISALTGIPLSKLQRALRTGRITNAQKVDGKWIIAENFMIIREGLQDDALIRSLPQELYAEHVQKDFNAELPEKKFGGNPNPIGGNKRQLRLPGFSEVTEGMTVEEIRAKTKVHNATQARIKRGEKVKAEVALRLARGLGVSVESLMAN